MTLEDADDLLELAEELERHALTHEKVIQHLDLARARRLRDLAARAHEVSQRGALKQEQEVLERDILSLRLEAMVALLSAPAREAEVPALKASGMAPAACGAPVAPAAPPMIGWPRVPIARIKPRR